VPDRSLPAEWAPQWAILLAWPHAESDWAPDLPAVEAVYARLGREVSRREALVVACLDAAVAERARGLLAAAGAVMERVHLHLAPSDDTWTRDFGPITVLEDGRPLLLDFVFNGWGGKYPAERDDAVTRTLHAAGAFGPVPLERVPLVLEGGAIESDGAGTLLTTERCLLAPTRNPHLDRGATEGALRWHLGAARVLWLRHGGLLGDDTDGHVDTLVRFCGTGTLCYQACENPNDANHEALAAMASELRTLRTARGEPYRLVPLPWPAPRHAPDGRRLPATYANFLVIDGAVLVPTYDDPADARALATLGRCFADRTPVGIPALPLIEQNGSLHCITMQLPTRGRGCGRRNAIPSAPNP
jgi:agmatine deiminase